MFQKHRGALVVLALALALAAGTALTSWHEAGPAAPPTGRHAEPPAVTDTQHRRPPNIILITTDDQNPDELRWMPRTRREIAGHGLTFTHALSPDPLCCPARAEIITGQLGQNNGVSSNLGLHGGFDALRGKQNTLAVWLRRAGYRTALVGKYLNGYTARDGRQHGWNRWNPSVAGIYSYVHTTFYRDGHRRTFRRNVDPVVGRFARQYVREFSASGKPFFIWASFLAPHLSRTTPGVELPPVPTRRRRHSLGHVRAPFLAKPTFGRVTGPQPSPGRVLPDVSRRDMQALFTRRIQSLLDVDDAIGRLMTTLRRTHQLGNTYVFFASDNGVLLGEHRLLGKDLLFEEALRVPLAVRVPGAGRGRSSRLPVTLVDLGPTIMSLAHATPGRRQDGRSFARVLHGGHIRWRDTQLIQAGRHASPTDPGAWSFRGARTPRYTYMLRVADGRAFLYDRRVDPFEAKDVALHRRYRHTLAALRRRTALLVGCAGASCNRRFGPVPPPRGQRPVSPGALPSRRDTPRR
jgi:N-acetylglucosamine-6-sulfatase